MFESCRAHLFVLDAEEHPADTSNKPRERPSRSLGLPDGIDYFVNCTLKLCVVPSFRPSWNKRHFPAHAFWVFQT